MLRDELRCRQSQAANMNGQGVERKVLATVLCDGRRWQRKMKWGDMLR